MRAFNNKTVMIIGATSGIGKASALIFAREGAKKIIVARRRVGEGTKVVSEIEAAGAQGLFVQMDVSDAANVKAGFDQAIESEDGVDALVVSAGRKQLHTWKCHFTHLITTRTIRSSR